MRCSNKRLWSGACHKTCYNRIARYCTVLQSSNLQCRVLQSIFSVRRSTTPYYQVFFEVLSKYYTALQSSQWDIHQNRNATHIKIIMRQCSHPTCSLLRLPNLSTSAKTHEKSMMLMSAQPEAAPMKRTSSNRNMTYWKWNPIFWISMLENNDHSLVANPLSQLS